VGRKVRTCSWSSSVSKTFATAHSGCSQLCGLTSECDSVCSLADGSDVLPLTMCEVSIGIGSLDIELPMAGFKSWLWLTFNKSGGIGRSFSLMTEWDLVGMFDGIEGVQDVQQAFRGTTGSIKSHLIKRRSNNQRQDESGGLAGQLTSPFTYISVFR
jgi:hypothetical protein